MKTITPSRRAARPKKFPKIINTARHSNEIITRCEWHAELKMKRSYVICGSISVYIEEQRSNEISFYVQF